MKSSILTVTKDDHNKVQEMFFKIKTKGYRVQFQKLPMTDVFF